MTDNTPITPEMMALKMGLDIPDFDSIGYYGADYGTMKPFHRIGNLLFLSGHVAQIGHMRVVVGKYGTWERLGFCKPSSFKALRLPGKARSFDATAHTTVEQRRIARHAQRMAGLRVHVGSPVRVAQANGRAGTLMGRRMAPKAQRPSAREKRGTTRGLIGRPGRR